MTKSPASIGPEMTPQEFKEARTALGWTQATVAEKTGVDVRTVRRWESGYSPVPKLTATVLNLWVNAKTAILS